MAERGAQSPGGQSNRSSRVLTPTAESKPHAGLRATTPEDVVRQGYIYKWTNFVKGWRRRYFVLHSGPSGMLEYYGSESKRHLLARISLGEAMITAPKKKKEFIIDTGKSVFYCRTQSQSDRLLWVQALEHSRSLAAGVGSDARKGQSLDDRLLELRAHKEAFLTYVGSLHSSLDKDQQSKLESLSANLASSSEEFALAAVNSTAAQAESDEESEFEGPPQSRRMLMRSMSIDEETMTFYSCDDAEDDYMDEDAEEIEDFELEEGLGDSDSSAPGSNVVPDATDSADVPGQVAIVKRRKKLPAARSLKKPSLWSILKDMVGKDLSRVCLPATWNEPLGTLQRALEEFEYLPLLSRAAASTDPRFQMLCLAGFGVSGYSATAKRLDKPFNPLLGETYEWTSEDNQSRFFAEQVSHHPPITAFHLHDTRYQLYGDVCLRNKFWGKSVEIYPVGLLHARFPNGHHFSWNKVTTAICNIVIGSIYLEHHGEMRITNHTNGDYCVLKFHKRGWFDGKHAHEVTGGIFDKKNTKLYSLFGKWDEALHYQEGERRPDAPVKTCWTRGATAVDADKYYDITPFGITLNEIDPGQQEMLPPTDTRLRPDQRNLDNGLFDKATEEKLRLEVKQREARKRRTERKEQWVPRWFKQEADEATGLQVWRFTDEYWKCRENKSWDRCPNVF